MRFREIADVYFDRGGSSGERCTKERAKFRIGKLERISKEGGGIQAPT